MDAMILFILCAENCHASEAAKEALKAAFAKTLLRAVAGCETGLPVLLIRSPDSREADAVMRWLPHLRRGMPTGTTFATDADSMGDNVATPIRRCRPEAERTSAYFRTEAARLTEGEVPFPVVICRTLEEARSLAQCFTPETPLPPDFDGRILVAQLLAPSA